MSENPRAVPEQREGLLRLHCYLESYAMRKAVVLRAQVYYVPLAPPLKKLELPGRNLQKYIIQAMVLWVKIFCKRFKSALSI